MNAGKRGRPLELLKLQYVEQCRGCRTESRDARVGISVRHAQAGESEFLHWIAGKYSEAVTVLNVVLHGVGIELHLIAHRQRILLRLIEVVAAPEHGETRADRPVKKIRLWGTGRKIAL